MSAEKVVRHRDGRFIHYRRGELLAAGMDDQTPEQRKWEPGKYDFDCSPCFLNIPHTERVHEERTA